MSFKAGDRVRHVTKTGEGEIDEVFDTTVSVRWDTGWVGTHFSRDLVAIPLPGTVTDELTPAGLLVLLQEADDELDDLRAAHDHAVYEANMRVLREFLTALAEKRVTAPAMGAEVLCKRLFPEDSQ